jgi:L-malate glycosyltransferase
MKNIIQLCTSPNKGGLELYFAKLSNSLSKNFEIFNVTGKVSAVKPELIHTNESLYINKSSHYFPLQSAFKLARFIDKHQIQVIHLHWNKDLALAIFAKIFSKQKPKVILTRHMQFPAKKDSYYHRFIYKNLDHIIAITHAMADDLHRFIPKNVQPSITTIYHGIEPMPKADTETITNIRNSYLDDENAFLIGLFGRISEAKGQMLLIKAIKKAKENKLPLKAVIVGHAMKDSYLEKLKQTVKELNLEKDIIFTGFIPQPHQLMQACDIITLTSKEETFGLVLIEAMSLGVSVIGSNRGGVVEIIEDQKDGLLFESQDFESLYDKLEYLYKNPSSRKGMAEKAYQISQTKFSYSKHIETVSELLLEL